MEKKLAMVAMEISREDERGFEGGPVRDKFPKPDDSEAGDAAKQKCGWVWLWQRKS